MEICKHCGKETELMFEETPDMIHYGRYLCDSCGGMLRWAKKEKNQGKRTTTSKHSIEIDYCQWCLRKKPALGPHETLHLHHMIPICFDGVDEKENLLTLCTACHRLAHWAQRYINHDCKSPLAEQQPISAPPCLDKTEDYDLNSLPF